MILIKKKNFSSLINNVKSLVSKDYELFKLNTNTDIHTVYQAYLKNANFYNPKFYKDNDREQKYETIKKAYLRIFDEKIKNLEILDEKEKNDLQELVKLNKGIIYEEFQTKTEKIMEEIEKNEDYKEPENYNLILFCLWGIFGSLSFFIEP